MPMQLVTPAAVDAYCREDIVLNWLDRHSTDDDEALTCQRWLRQTPAKRMVFQALYGDMLDDASHKRRILDVGGGLTALTIALARQHDYTLVDLMAHDTPHSAQRASAIAGRNFIHPCDWYEWQGKQGFDIVIANDLFPNVDQRLELFLGRMLPMCQEIRMSLTYYNRPRFYMTRRVDAEEFLCMLAWNGEMTRNALMKYASRISQPDLGILLSNEDSAYANGRQVCLLRMEGDLVRDASSRAP